MGARGTGRGDEEFHRDPRPVVYLSQVDKICQEFVSYFPWMSTVITFANARTEHVASAFRLASGACRVKDVQNVAAGPAQPMIPTMLTKWKLVQSRQEDLKWKFFWTTFAVFSM
jgi:hypothetical protein